MRNYKVFLASQSPRRRELMGYLFNNIEILPLGSEEPGWDGKELPLEYLERCVNHKWEGACQAYSNIYSAVQQSLLLVADTIVVLDRKVYGKPKDKPDAQRILRELSGRSHSVYTGFRLGLGPSTRLACESGFRFERTELAFRKLAKADIAAYVRTGEPMDKAGAYGFQGRALPFVDWIRGSYSNVLGLPVEAVRKTVLDLEASA